MVQWEIEHVQMFEGVNVFGFFFLRTSIYVFCAVLSSIYFVFVWCWWLRECPFARFLAVIVHGFIQVSAVAKIARALVVRNIICRNLRLVVRFFILSEPWCFGGFFLFHFVFQLA